MRHPIYFKQGRSRHMSIPHRFSFFPRLLCDPKNCSHSFLDLFLFRCDPFIRCMVTSQLKGLNTSLEVSSKSSRCASVHKVGNNIFAQMSPLFRFFNIRDVFFSRQRSCWKYSSGKKYFKKSLLIYYKHIFCNSQSDPYPCSWPCTKLTWTLKNDYIILKYINEICSFIYMFLGLIIFTQPLHSGRIWHKVNF